jgi:hypothetical protein
MRAGASVEPQGQTQRMIDGESDTNLLTTQRAGEFRYDIPLTQGTHELRLHFAETAYGPGNALGGGEAARLFNSFINGVEAVKWFDPLAEAGGPNQPGGESIQGYRAGAR